MRKFEYKIIPAPKQAEKRRGLKTTEDRFAATLTEAMNQLGRDGWEYLRADTLPCEERSGFTGRTTTFQNMLVFRREAGADVPAMPEPVTDPATPQPVVAPLAVPAPITTASVTSDTPRLTIAVANGPAPTLGPARPKSQPAE